MKKISEEKLVAKEEDGGGASVGGGVVNSPGDSGSADIVANEPPTNTGLSTTDVLGKCDHRKDGIFGPGCFHLPCIWSVPSYRYQKKRKKRKLPYANIVKEDEGFQQFLNLANPIIEEQRKSAQAVASVIDREITVEIEEDYPFEGEKEDWVAALDKENQADVKNFTIALNLKVLYSFLYENGLETDKKEIYLQVRVSIFHELAHAIIQYFRDTETFDFELTEMEEEKMAEEFGKYSIKKYSDTYTSKLANFMKQIYRDDGEFDFTLTESDADKQLIEKIHAHVESQIADYKRGSSPSTRTIEETHFSNTDHWASERDQRRINVRKAGGLGKNIIARYTWDKNHPRGPEFHYITDNAIIIITNIRDELQARGQNKKIITELVARPGQLERYLYVSRNGTGKNILTKETAATPNWTFPDYVMKKAEQHQKLGLNVD